VEVRGLTAPPDLETITGVPLSTDTPVTGTFESSDPFVNRLASNVYWSQRSNFIEIPTDCPQRDERLGWCDAAWTFVYAGSLRADIQTFYNKWTTDLDDAQRPDGLFPWLAPLVVTLPEVTGPFWEGCSPAWSDAGVICPWAIYQIYGDQRQLAEHYPAMVRQVEWYRITSRPNLLPPDSHKCLGDWLNYNSPIPPDVFRTAFFAYSTGLVARSAEALGKSDDATRYAKLHAEIRSGFQRAYVDSEGRILGDTQSAYALAIVFDLLEEAQIIQAAKHLIANIEKHGWRPTTGLEATLPLMLALAQIGRNDVAYRLLHSEDFPSWNFSSKNGATTIWERWDSWTPEKGFGDPNMNSFNHFSLGAVYQWMAENIGGIQQEGISYQRLCIAPCPGGKLTSASVSSNCVRGLIWTDWKMDEGVLDLKVLIPANTSATIILPTTEADNVTEGARSTLRSVDLEIISKPGERITLSAGSGAYRFLIHDPLLAILPDQD
jgi:alpha-L-rhamnosidase